MSEVTYVHVFEPVQIDYDYRAKTAYIRVRPGEYHHGQSITEDCRIDFDADGNVIGIELLNQEPYPIPTSTVTTTN